MGYIRKTCTERGMPFVHIGESTGARLPDAMGSKGMGTMLGNDTTQFRRLRDTPWAAAALDTSFRLFGLAVLLRRFLGHEKRLYHVGFPALGWCLWPLAKRLIWKSLAAGACMPNKPG